MSADDRAQAQPPFDVVDISDETDPMAWTEAQLREDFSRRGWDYDDVVERGRRQINRLVTEHMARAARRKARES